MGSWPKCRSLKPPQIGTRRTTSPPLTLSSIYSRLCANFLTFQFSSLFHKPTTTWIVCIGYRCLILNSRHVLWSGVRLMKSRSQNAQSSRKCQRMRSRSHIETYTWKIRWWCSQMQVMPWDGSNEWPAEPSFWWDFYLEWWLSTLRGKRLAAISLSASMAVSWIPAEELLWNLTIF